MGLDYIWVERFSLGIKVSNFSKIEARWCECQNQNTVNLIPRVLSYSRTYGALRVGERTWERGWNTVNPLLSHRGAYFFQALLTRGGGGGLIEGGGLKERGAYLI